MNRLTLDFVSATKDRQSAQEFCPFLQYRAKRVVRHVFLDQFSFDNLNHDFEARYTRFSFRLELCRTRMGIHGQGAKVLSDTSVCGKGKN